jgi:tRNA 5-methylaminomethyl-2-thiouridine biosynthesis bifunctional protein
MRVAIIGGGLAGCALAYVLKRAGAEPVIYEAGSEIAPGASGNPVGLYNPRFTAEFGPEAEFYSAAFVRALAVFEDMADIDWNPCGALHLINDEKKEKRFAQTVQNWPAPQMRIVDAAEASEIAGIPLSHAALYLPRSGSVSPKTLCAAYVRGVEVQFNAYFSPPEGGGEKYEALVLACGMGVLKFCRNLPLKAVRGQVSIVRANEVSAKLKTALCYGGYVSAAVNGAHVVGSSFQRWLDHTDLLAQDDADNLAKLVQHVPALVSLDVIGARAAIRTTAEDHFPVVGQVDENLYVSTAHGSHGILSSLMAAEVLAAQILKKKPPLSEAVLQRLSPDRF